MLERINNLIYESKEKVNWVVNGLSIICSFIALGLILYENGYHLTEYQQGLVHQAMDFIFGVFAFNYIIRFFYSFKKKEFIKTTWLEGLIVVMIIITGINKQFFQVELIENLFRYIGVDNYKKMYRVVITIGIFYFIGFDIVKVNNYIHSLALKPAGTFALSFVLLIASGAALLMLPEMTTDHKGAPFLTAVYTSTSACCVTGLIIVDTATYFTFKGQLVILLLIQLGGIGIVSFATFFATFMKKGFGLKHQAIIQDSLSAESLQSAKSMLRRVIAITFTIEALASLAIFLTWGNEVVFQNIGQKIYFSVFHAISAFCNAGFSLFTNGLYETPLQGSLLLHISVACTIILGGIGFSTIQDVLSPRSMRERMRKPWKDWKLSSKIAIFTSFALIVLGTLVIYLTEFYNPTTLGPMGYIEAIVAAFFQSVSTRTAGFNTINFTHLQTSTIIFMIFLMFIGASSGSTGGGIKTSTFLLITASAFATIRGKKNVDIGKRTITTDLLYKAFSVFVIAASYNLLMIFALSVTDPNLNILDLVFEQVSAFGTVGLSTGISSSISVAGKWIIIFSMFVGRIGTLTLALALSSEVATNKYQYPTVHVMIG